MTTQYCALDYRRFVFRRHALKRAISLLTAFGFLSASAPLLLAQDLQSQPSPVPPSNIVGPQLIVWSQLQKPQPVPQPLPDPERKPGHSAKPRTALQPAVRMFAGTIVKDRGRNVLRITSGSMYLLDDEQVARKSDGQEVRPVGSLNENGNGCTVLVM